MTSDCGVSLHFVDSHLIGDIESRMKDFVKFDPSATIVDSGRSTISVFSMSTLTVCATDAKGSFHDLLLPAMNMSGLGRHLFSGGMMALERVNTAIAKESYLDVGQFKLPLRKDTDRPKMNYINLKFVPKGNFQTEVAFPTRVILGHAISTGSVLAS